MNVFTAALTLTIVMDPLGNVPVFLSMLSRLKAKRRYWVIARESIFAFMILSAFLFFGDDILLGLGISPPALSISGGIILFLIALGMIFPRFETQNRDNDNSEPFVVPLAIPMIAGPSAIATIMLLSSETPGEPFLLLVSLSIASGICMIILLFSGLLQKILGKKGLIAIERLIGMILTAIAVEMFLKGVRLYFSA